MGMRAEKPASPGGREGRAVSWGDQFGTRTGGFVVAKRPSQSRYRRLPGISRLHERKPADPGLEPQRVTLYLPGNLLDQAEAMALRSGHETVQQFCEAILTREIAAAHDRERVHDVEARRGKLEGLEGITDDADFLAEFSASRNAPAPPPTSPLAPDPRIGTSDGPGEWEVLPPAGSEGSSLSGSAEVVLRHAGVGVEDPSAFLPTLRRGEPIGPEATRELLQALTDLEVEYRESSRLDRRLAYALHRLAFEGQVLLTDAWPTAAADEGTVDVLRIVQEAVDRVLSGEDIRYYSQGPEPEPSP